MLFLLFTGAIAGILAGLLGIGGGLVIVPAILFWLQQQGLESNSAIQIAIATSLASMLLTSLGSLIAHNSRQAVHWRYTLRYAPFIMFGAWVGSLTVSHITRIGMGKWLIVGFAIFAIFTAYQLLKKKPKPTAPSSDLSNPAPIHFKWQIDSIIGIAIGHLSSLLGIGGGSLNAPYFHWRGLPMAHAVGTAATCGYPLAIAGTFGFLLQPTAITATTTSSEMIGSVAISAATVIGLTGFLFAPMGAKLAHALPEQRLRQVFAILLVVLAIVLILKY